MKVECTECGLEFLETPTRVNRIKSGTIFCSVSCRTKHRNKTLTDFQADVFDDVKTGRGTTIVELAHLNLSYRTTIERTLKKLIALNLVEVKNKQYRAKKKEAKK
jgi:hypothetical protein